jgi:TolB-like protein/Tfp pilus assembly protein PilF
MTTTRRLAAILAADVVGYSRLMGLDEAGTLASVRKLRAEVIEPKIAKHQGRLFKSMGDGFLVEFPSVVNAVACAAAIQTAMAGRNADMPENRQIQLRMGVHLGDVISEGDDVYGDGVNVAARIEGLAPPGGVAVSAMVHDNVGSRLDLAFEDMGEQQLKNIARPVRLYRLSASKRPTTQAATPERIRPSIAVLPFTNMSGDANQEYFADGIVEDIITALSRFKGLFVIARNSSFTYKGRAVDVKQVGRELGVRYVLEGSVRKSNDRVRITGQLIDTATGSHLWAERFEGQLVDIFDLQDTVTSSVVGAIAPKLEAAEIERSLQKPTESMEAYDHFLRGVSELHKWSREGNDAALRQFKAAIQLDPNYAAAHGFLARTHVQRKSGNWIANFEQEFKEMVEAADKAVELSGDDAVALCTAGFALVDCLGRVEDGDALIERALTLNPNLAWAWLYSGWAKAALGQSEVALERIAQAKRLSPNDPQKFSMFAAEAFALLFAGKYDEAFASAKQAIRERSTFILPHCIAAASAALAGHHDDAKVSIASIQQIDSSLNLRTVHSLTPIPRTKEQEIWIEGLRKAGLPE